MRVNREGAKNAKTKKGTAKTPRRRQRAPKEKRRFANGHVIVRGSRRFSFGALWRPLAFWRFPLFFAFFAPSRFALVLAPPGAAVKKSSRGWRILV
jgi:hypothetical protein